MAERDKAVRVFISSTFRDMHAERDHLVTVVFPELRERLDRLGLEFFDVDLRWGVPDKNVDGETANSWEYCKQWINRVEPFFLCVLGQRYGWIPKPAEILDDEDRAMYQGLSVTEMEIRHAVLGGRLHRRSFFYCRSPKVPASISPAIYQEFVDAGAQDRLEALKAEIGSFSPAVRTYDCRWTGSGFDRLEEFGQMVLEDLWSGVLRDERYVTKEVWRKVLGHEPDGNPLYRDYAQTIPPEVWHQIVKEAQPEPKDPLDAEAEQMAAFAASRLRWFRGRIKDLAELKEFVGKDLPEEASRICVIRSVAGQGKSALMAKLSEQLASSPHLVVTHFVGVTNQSSDCRSLLERLVKVLARNDVPGSGDDELEDDYESLRKEFSTQIERYDGQRRIVILIDAVNQLTDGRELSWLPLRPGPNVRIVITSIDGDGLPLGSPEAAVMAALKARRPEPCWVNLEPLAEADVKEVVVDYLLEYCKVLDKANIEDIGNLRQARNPLYLLVMLNELRTLGGNDMNKIVQERIANMAKDHPDTVNLFNWVLERLEVFGREPVRLWCTYLALGRAGMSSRELSDLLARKLGEEAAKTALVIERGIRRYLQQRGPQLDFFHGQFRTAVDQRYLKDDSTEYHIEIADYLATRWQEPNTHALSELPYHETAGRQWPKLEATLTDLEFIEARFSAGLAYELLRDIDREGVVTQKPVLALVRRAVASSLAGVRSHPEYCLPMLWNRLRWLVPPDLPAEAIQTSLAKAWRRLNTTVWLRANALLPETRRERPHTFAIPGARIQALCMRSRRLAIVDLESDIVIMDATSGETIARPPVEEKGIKGIALADDDHGVVVLTKRGSIRYNAVEPAWRVRQSENLLDCLPGPDVICVRDDNSLMAWNPQSGEEQVLVRDIPGPLTLLRRSVDGAGFLFVAGYRKQICGVARKTGAAWEVTPLPELGTPVVAGDLDLSTGHAALATTDARILLIDLTDRRTTAQWRYEHATGSRLRGMAKQVAFGVGPTARTVFLGTETGQIWSWNPLTNQSGSYGSYRNRREGGNLLCLGVWPDSGLPFVTTEFAAQTLVPEDAALAPQEPVTALCFTNSNSIVAARYQSQSVTWYTPEGLQQTKSVHVPWPLTVSTGVRPDRVWVGGRSGLICEASVDQQGIPDDAGFVANPVIGVFPARDSDMVWAAEANGDISCIHIFVSDPAQTKQKARVLWAGTGFERRLKVLPASPNGTFWCMTISERNSSVQIALVDGQQSATSLLEGNDIADIAISNDLGLLAVVGDAIRVYGAQDGKWVELNSCRVAAYRAVFSEDGEWLALAQGRWLEIRRVAAGLPLAAAQDLPSEIVCLAARADAIAAGLQAGDVVSFVIERGK